jgi:hypothetical protein
MSRANWKLRPELFVGYEEIWKWSHAIEARTKPRGAMSLVGDDFDPHGDLDYVPVDLVAGPVASRVGMVVVTKLRVLLNNDGLIENVRIGALVDLHDAVLSGDVTAILCAATEVADVFVEVADRARVGESIVYDFCEGEVAMRNPPAWIQRRKKPPPGVYIRKSDLRAAYAPFFGDLS